MEKDSRIALVAIGRLENRYAREWVEHHLRVGFTHIYVCDNNHEGEEHFEDVLDEFVADGVVTILNYRGKVAVQKAAYNKTYEQIKNDYDWVAFFDFDEFLEIRKGTLQSMLQEAQGDVVVVNWQCYGDNGLVYDDGRPVQERFTEPLPGELCVQYNRPENDHVKSIVRGGLKRIKFERNPHVPEVDGRRGTSTYQTAAGRPCNGAPLQVFDGEVAVLNHYITKTAEEWVQRRKRGTGSRNYGQWQRDYADRFFRYNERTAAKEKVLARKKTVAIVNYNTPELTAAAIRSVRLHGGADYEIVVLDNSDERPFKRRMKGVKVIDNTKGQIVDFDQELAKFKNKTPHGVHGKCVYGSDKHMMSIQALFDLLPEGFLIMDSDVLLRQPVDFMFQWDQCAVGHVQTHLKSKNKYGIDRLVPILCWINVPMCKSCGIRYWDPARSWALHGDTRASWYDTGASFLEDIRKHQNGACGKRIDIRPLMEHLKSGSWINAENHKEWLEQHKELWHT